MWRPEQWQNPYQEVKVGNDRVVSESPEEAAYEAGADAMLEALFSEACKYGKKWVLIKKANGEVEILLD